MKRSVSCARFLLSLLLSLCLLLPGMALAEKNAGYTYRVDGWVTPVAPIGKDLLLRSTVVSNMDVGDQAAFQGSYYLYTAADRSLTEVDATALTAYFPAQFMTDGTFYALSVTEMPITLGRFRVADGRVEALDTVQLEQDAAQVAFWHGAAVLGDVVYVLWQPAGEAAESLEIRAYDRISGAFIEALPIRGAEAVAAAQDKLVISLGGEPDYKFAVVLYDPADKSQKVVGTNKLEDSLTLPRRFKCDPVSGMCVITGTEGFYRWDLKTGAVKLLVSYDMSEVAGSFLFFDSQLILDDDRVLVFPVK